MSSKLITVRKGHPRSIPFALGVDRLHNNIFDGADGSWMDSAAKYYNANTGGDFNLLSEQQKKLQVDDYMNSTGNNWFGISKKNNIFSKGNLASGGIGDNILALGTTMVGNAIGNFIGGGLLSKAGSVLSGLGDIASKVPIYGKFAGPALKIAAGGVNALIGTSVDQAKLDAANSGTAAYSNFTSNASSLDDIKGPIALANVLNAFKGGVLKKGWAKKENQKIKQQRVDARLYAVRSIAGNANNILDDLLNNDLSEYKAFGGPLDGIDISSPIGYAFMSQYLDTKKQDKNMTNMFAGAPSSIFAMGGDKDGDFRVNIMRTGGPKKAYHTNKRVRISPKTETSKRWTELSVSTRQGSSIPFLGNTELITELVTPDKKDTTYLVRPSLFTREYYRSTDKDRTDYDKVHRRFVDLYNDGVTETGIGNEDIIDVRKYDIGGNLFDIGGVLQEHGGNFSTNVTHVNTGGTHEGNPYEGVLMGVDSQGTPNLVEEGEVIYNDYVFSNRLTIPKHKYAKGGKLRKNAEDIPYEQKVLRKFEGLTFADAAKRIEKLTGADERVADEIAIKGMEAQLEVLAQVQEKEREKEKLKELQEAIDNMTPEEFEAWKQLMQAQMLLQKEQLSQEQATQELAMQQLAMQEQAMALQLLLSPELAALMLQMLLTLLILQPIAANGGYLNKFGDGGTMSLDDFESKLKEYGLTLADYVVAIRGASNDIERLKILNEYKNNPELYLNEESFKEDGVLLANEYLDLIKNYVKTNNPLYSVLLKNNISGEQWNNFNTRLKERYIKQYKRTLSEEERERFNNNLSNYNTQLAVDNHRKKQASSNLVLDDIKGMDYDSLQRIASVLNKDYTPTDITLLSDEKAKEVTDKLKNDIVSWAKDNPDGTLESLSKRLSAPDYHTRWDKTALDDLLNKANGRLSRWSNAGYDFDTFANTTAAYNGSLNMGNVKGNYAVDPNFALGQTIDGKDITSVKELEELPFYREYTDAGTGAINRNLNLKWKYNDDGSISYDGDVQVSPEDENLIRAIYQQVGRTKINPDGANVPLFTTDDNGWISFNNNITAKNTKYDNAAKYFRHLREDGDLGAMHLTPSKLKSSTLYTLNDKDYYSLEDMQRVTPDWEKYYQVADAPNLSDGTIVKKLSYKDPITFARMNSLPEGITLNEDGTYTNNKEDALNTFPKAPTWPYIAGIGLLGAGLLYNILSPKDYKNADAMINASMSAGNYIPINYNPRGNFHTYTPDDPWFYTSPILAQSNSALRAFLNKNMPSADANTLANSYNTMTALGLALRLQLEHNFDKEFKTIEANNTLGNTWSEGFLKADMANLDAANRAKALSLLGLRSGYAMKQAIDDAKSNAISAGISGLANLGMAAALNDYNNKLTAWRLYNNPYAISLMEGYHKANGGNLKRKKKGLGF